MGKRIDETLEWIGISLILVAYAMNMFGVLDTKNTIYLLMNILGSLGVVYVSFKKKDYQPGVLNIVWAVVAIIALVGLFI
jgi:O-antigen ligase